MDKVLVGRARNPKDDNRLGYAMHIPGRKYRVKMSASQWHSVSAWFNGVNRSILPEKDYGAYIRSRQKARRRLPSGRHR